ncbi:hypothetical protein GNP63_18130 [Aliivibrio fischeri]|uniref:CFI-box-CTERM domain-containing protein n=1 Tax=Aliivibrio fischeri TaxID=668 RepID=UPI0012D97653|nr:CFI-box-CTERM domain-containing protein [Aliivibrio fischeri]MUH98446.1 hypothetical protein [Aliivibrio fischeri]MUI65939.1 hypothetical protein [Aliivibrio fischeri]
MSNKELITKDILNNALANLDAKQMNALSEKAAQEALQIQKQEVNRDSLEIRSRKEAEDHVDTFNELSKDGRIAHEVVTKSTTATGSRTITSRSGAATAKSACFVATSAFEDNNHSTVDDLRIWRDASLRKHRAGQKFITWYYKNGPQLASWLDNHSQFKPLVRRFLTMFVNVIKNK